MKRLFACAAAVLLFTGSATAASVPCKEEKSIERFEGAEIIMCEMKNFEEYRLMTGKIKDYNLDKKGPTFDSSDVIEGPLTQIVYRIKKGPSALEVFRNYQESLKGAGYEPLFEADQGTVDARNGDYAGYYFGETKFGPGSQYLGYSPNNLRFGSYRKKSEDGDISIALFIVEYQDGYVGGIDPSPVKDDIIVRLDIAKPKAMKKQMVGVSAKEIDKQLSTGGKVAIYGILFDFNKANIKAESKPALEQIAEYLKDNEDAKLWVVGHTDNAGGQEFNQELSEKRAEAVVDALRDDYDIRGKRLKAAGVGLLAPTAPNTDEEGRAKNRRVELIPQ
jgi:OmpA-OmpF porin, OOP family